MLLFELRGADVAECGVQATLIVNVVDEAGKLLGDFIEGLERHRIDFEGRHEAFHLGVVVWVSAPPHRADQVMGRQQFLIDAGRVLRSAIGMMIASPSITRSPPSTPPARAARLSTCRSHSGRRGVTGNQDDHHIGEASADGDIGQVRDPELVRAIEDDTLRMIREDGLIMVTVGGGDVTSTAAWLKIVLAHQALDPLVVGDHALMAGAA